jgi:hypothetical protein
MIARTAVKCVCVLLVTAFVTPVWASPALPVTKPPLLPVPSWTGPIQDPHALQGQWFKDLTTGAEHAKPYEFYDNVEGHGGSLFKSSLAIEGYVQNLQFDANNCIVAFDIRASITNDTPDIWGMWQEGGNAHGESTTTRTPYQCNMYQVKMTVEFADDGIRGNLPTGGPYSPEGNIFAKNFDQLGWYCWTPDPSAPQPTGGYYVPTYDFGEIMHWQTATRILPFGLYLPECPGSTLYQFLIDADQYQWDVLLNRTTSLKISQYLDVLAQDPGTPYPVPPNNSSDVSVFFIPEPLTLVLVGLGGLMLFRRRRS